MVNLGKFDLTILKIYVGYWIIVMVDKLLQHVYHTAAIIQATSVVVCVLVLFLFFFFVFVSLLFLSCSAVERGVVD